MRCMKDTTCQVKYPESCNHTNGQACESSMAMCVPILKLGECPVSSSLDTNMTQNECVDDQDCLDDYKCCPSQSKYNSCTSKIILMCEMSVLFNRMLPVFLLLLKNHAWTWCANAEPITHQPTQITVKAAPSARVPPHKIRPRSVRSMSVRKKS